MNDGNYIDRINLLLHQKLLNYSQDLEENNKIAAQMFEHIQSKLEKTDVSDENVKVIISAIHQAFTSLSNESNLVELPEDFRKKFDEFCIFESQ